MSFKQFWVGLGLSILTCASIVGLILFFAPDLRIHAPFSALSVALFSVLSIGTYYAGNAAAKNSNKYAFNNLIVVSVFIKLVGTLTVLFLYKKVMQPTEGWFAVIFLLIYAVFTSFEVIFLTRQAKT